MMRVLHVIDHLGLGGAQAVLYDIVLGLRPLGLHCAVAAIHHRGNFASKLEEAGIAVHLLASSKWSPIFPWRFVSLLDRFRPDCIHFHLQASNWILKPLAALTSSARRVAHDHSSADLRFRGMATLPVDALAHTFSHRVVAVSPSVKDFLCRCEGVRAEQIALVPNAVDTLRFHPASFSERLQARRALGLPAEAFVFGALGRLAPEKNFVLLPRVAARCPWAVGVVGGEGPCRQAIEKSAAAADVTSRFHLLGHVENREQFYQALDVFVLPSLYEGLPVVLLEAMACGLPIISSPLPDICHTLENNGLYAPPDSPEAWASALQSLRQSRELSARLSQRARQHCLENHDLSVACTKLQQVYLSLGHDALLA